MNTFNKWLPAGIGLLILTSLLSAPLAAADLDKRVQVLERRLSGLSDLVMQVEALKRENSQLRGQIEEQNHTIESLKKRQRDLYIDIDSRLSRLQSAPASSAAMVPPAPVLPATAPPAVPPVTQAPVVPVKPVVVPPVHSGPIVQKTVDSISTQEKADYDAAFKLLSPSQKRYGDAIVAMQQFLTNYPDSALADNAQYWLAEANYVSRKNEQALLEFEKLLTLYPHSPKVSGALLKKGYLLHISGQPDEAKKTLQKVIDNYPGSAAANMAKSRIQRIQSEQR